MADSIYNILHITSWLSRAGGGIPPVIWSLARESQRAGLPCSVAGLKDRLVELDCTDCGVPILAGKIKGPRALGFSPELRTLLQAQPVAGGIIHSHGLWMHPGLLARELSIATGCPLIISPHGMLEPWALNNSRWKKRLAGYLFENRNLQAAHCLHALCVPEAENFRRFGLRNPIAIIPNGVDLAPLSSLPNSEAIAVRFPELKNRRRILFLSRIHPKKGLPVLLQAWKKLSIHFKDWSLMIAGPDQLGHTQELQVLAKELEIDTSVAFLGPAYGEDKRRALAAAAIFVLPSFSEGFSMAILEAAATGLPVLLTKECNFPELALAQAAVEVTPDAAGVESGLRKLLKMSDDQRRAMGRRGMELAQKNYTWPAVTQKMLAVYDWLRGKGPRPDCMFSD